MQIYEDIFRKNKWFVISFLITFIFFLFFYWKNSVGLFFDIPASFASVLFQIDDNHTKFLMITQNRTRTFDDLLIAIPFNILFSFIKDNSIIYSLKLWSSSYFIVHLFGLIIMYLSARRTKRYDIAAIGFLFYIMFCIPNAIWAIREINIAIPFYFALLTYFLSYEKFNYTDIIPIFLLSVYMFESFETAAVLGLIFFIFSNLYIKRDNGKNEQWSKALIGFFGLLYFIYIPLRTIYLGVKNSVNISLGFFQWIDSSIHTFNNLFSGNLLICWFAFLFIIIAVFYKKQFDWKSILFFISFIVILTVFVLYFKTGFVPNPKIELHYYSLALLFIYPVFLLIIFLDYCKIDIYKFNKFLFSNLIIIASIFGILNLTWQIHSFYEFGKYESYLKNLINKTDNVVLNIPKEDFNKYTFLNNNMCFGTMLQAIFLTEKGRKSKIIYPSEYFCDYSEFCFDDVKNTYYDKSKDVLYIQTAPFKIKTKYWDLSDIVDVFKEQGRVKNI